MPCGSLLVECLFREVSSEFKRLLVLLYFSRYATEKRFQYRLGLHRVEYLRHLREVVKPTGRLCVIEKYSAIATRGASHGTSLSQLVREAEQAGWIAVRCELMTGTEHYLSIFLQKDLFGPEP